MKELRGKTALVTGASRGIGVHIARALAREGMHLGLVARNAEALAKVAAELAGEGVRAIPLAVDLESTSQHDDLLARAAGELGPIDVLVNNAGIDRAIAYADETLEGIEKMVRLDLSVPMLLTRRLLPDLLARKSGHIVNVASLAGKSASPHSVTYGAAKAGLIAFSHSLRVELRGSGVSVSVVNPGFVSGEGMFANRGQAPGLVVPASVGTSTPMQVAQGVVRALRGDKAEVHVAPGPIRAFLALNQLAPDFVSWVQGRMGVNDVLRSMAEADSKARLSAPAGAAAVRAAVPP